jgi:ArsR family transcriptional regulator
MQKPLSMIDERALVCCPIDRPGLLPGEAEEIAARFRALSDPTRVRIMNLLLSRGASTCVCDMWEAFDLSQPTVSHHLKVLREAGLVDCERRGTWVYYWPMPDRLRWISTLLAVPEPVH